MTTPPDIIAARETLANRFVHTDAQIRAAARLLRAHSAQSADRQVCRFINFGLKPDHQDWIDP